ncbi:MAG: bifunctional histidinol-phosphatase/imidazoleglycerol-phosphate dehydratase HisB [Gammaproteobacteria bacterium]
MSPRLIAFVDRDGTIIEEPEDFQIDRYDKLAFVPGAISGLRTLLQRGYELVLVSNQDGLGTAAFPQEDFDGPHKLMHSILASEGIRFAAELICPHLPDAGCDCRKPAVGLLREYLADDSWSRAKSVVIGDRDTDLQLAANLGVRGLRIGANDAPDWPHIVDEITAPENIATVVRKTKETDIRVRVSLNDATPSQIDSGIGFFDHMLEQLARHGGFALALSCRGDLHIDEHHTVEDCALALGEALARVTADKRGLGRYGFVVAMDEARASATIDLSGRAFCSFNAPLQRDSVGGLPNEMVRHFFASLATAARLTLHVDVTGENDHHMVEGAFKATGRALRQALARFGNRLPSTKGVL